MSNQVRIEPYEKAPIASGYGIDEKSDNGDGLLAEKPQLLPASTATVSVC